MLQLIIAWKKWEKVFWAKVDLDRKKTAWDIIDKLTNLVNSVWKAELDTYSIFITK